MIVIALVTLVWIVPNMVVPKRHKEHE
jgi:hypothetical protein